MAEGVGDSDRILKNLSQMMRAFSHTVRGDLSVINNDLSYLSTLLPNEDIGASLARCTSITAALRDIQFVQSEQFKSSPTTVEALFRESFAPTISVVYSEGSASVMIPAIDLAITQRAMTVIHKELFAAVSAVSVVAKVSPTAQLSVHARAQNANAALSVENSIGVVDAAASVRGEASIPVLALADITLALQSIRCRVHIERDSSAVSSIEYVF